MKTLALTYSGWLSLAWPAALWIAGLSIAGSAGWLWSFAADDSAWRAVSLVTVLALAALVSLLHASRARADGRWRAALDRYAEQEQAKRTYSRRNPRARPQSQARSTTGGAAR
jgi:hypothetical protein